ncbi:MAG: sulfate ABC transporter substrate-binding protein [Pseudomonadota bacterium]
MQALKSLKSALAVALVAGTLSSAAVAAEVTLLNVSYDPTRELYEEYNKAFAAHWKAKTGDDVTVKQSHGGSGKQARAVIDGLEADVVTLALAYDIDEIVNKGKLFNADWQKEFRHNSSPYTSTIVFLVRKGNPKGIKDWGDLVKPGTQVITPNPKTSGGARWNYLAGWAWAAKNKTGDTASRDAAGKKYVTDLFRNVPVLDSGARGSTVTFAERGLGDVLITWENEAYLAKKEFGADKFDIVIPPFSILAEPPVAIVDKNVQKRGNEKVAKAYLEYLYSPEGQEIAAKNFYRPTDSKVAKKYESQFPTIKFASIADFGGWAIAQKTHFGDGGIFDQIYQPVAR